MRQLKCWLSALYTSLGEERNTVAHLPEWGREMGGIVKLNPDVG